MGKNGGGGGGILKNPRLKLNSNEELDLFQFGYNGFDCKIYDFKNKIFRNLTDMDYIQYCGFGYDTLWSLGCPYACTYCCNTAFQMIDKNYSRIRYCSPINMIKELVSIKALYPWVNRIIFDDDNFMAIPIKTIKEFCDLYKKYINLPFCVNGIHPNTINSEKIELLASAGMIRTRMGIQSTSDHILKFYERNTSKASIIKGVELLANASKKYKMIPPVYDIIVDNPIETKEDMIENLKTLNELSRPFTFNISSLRSFPGTKLDATLKENDIKCSDLPYTVVRPTIINILIYLITVFKIPEDVFKKCLKKIKKYDEQDDRHTIMFFIARFFYLFKRGISHLVKFDFSNFSGKWLYYFWKLFLKKRKNIVPEFNSEVQ